LKIYLKVCFTMTCLLTGLATADPGVTRIPVIDAPKGTAGLGMGFRGGTNPYRNLNTVSSILNDSQVDLVPLYLYEGKYLFSHGTEAGVHLFDTDRFGFDILARYRFDRLESDADPYYEGMSDRRQTVESGARAWMDTGLGRLSATWIADTLGRHDGQEFELTWRANWKSNRWSISPFVSYVAQDSDLIDYYYGVSPAEARPDRPAYKAGSDDFFRGGVNTLLYANIAFEGVPDEVANSPLVDEETRASAMAGLTYMFGSVLDPKTASKKKPETTGDWSWRINGGYTAEHTFHKVHRGYLKRSEDVHTYLAGLTLGKLLQAGRKIQFWGKFSLNRRFENDYQDDFFEYNAYVSAMGIGYSPWTDRELFRYGFGFGFSYADKVPYIEQVKQEKRGRNTAHFLNYLEAQVDFPLRALFGSRASDKCYVGFTIVHRSGIFASSDILGNVSGGSDVFTAHLECIR
jgi:outer membrane scaffolding protein for murein synthesis (MipA/OmpV family)